MALLFTLVMCVLVVATRAAGSGRAFPIGAENYIIEKFQRINPLIEWDPTNYLVDKSGYFANCAQIRRGYENTNEQTPEGSSIGVVYDHINGHGVDVESVNTYIASIVDDWISSRLYDRTIAGADTFGCSVRPGCNGVITVACLFSPGGQKDPNDEPEQIYEPKGLAFTQEQYDMAEMITGNKWDRSHFLENLSGLEITCDMLGSPQWDFTESTILAKEYGMNVLGLKGSAPNLGSTQDAMEKVLKSFKSIRSATQVGCSVIPDCTSGRGDLGSEMWVIISCIYEEF